MARHFARSWSLVCLVLTLFTLCKSQSNTKKPAITYVAGPNQLTLLLDQSAFRFGYDTDNQFRAERRFPNGTVAGYYGYVRADGKPVRVKYGAVDDLGFSAIQEIIPAAFPEQPTTESSSEESGSGAEPIQTNESPIMSDEDQKKVILLSPMEPVVDEEKESVSIDVADYYRGSLDTQPLLPASRFTYPKIDVPDLPKRRVRSTGWAPPIPVQRAAQRTVVLEKVDGEPAILYAPPTRFLTKAGVTFAIN